ncbi:MAG: cytochrome c [Bdellovibrionales bacterium]|nr:cytochrome c [Bdellovibrionales bacterium]
MTITVLGLLFGLAPFVHADESLQFSLSPEIAQAIQPALKNPVLKTWAIAELKGMKQVTRSEKDPQDGKMVAWKGVLFSSLIDEVLKSLPAEVKAQIDLVVFRGKGGTQALVPRAFTVKYPVLMALGASGKEGGFNDLGPVYSVIPWTTVGKIKSEEAPVQSFFIPGVSEIQFSNYRKVFGKFFLAKRTDPAAMRGEKLFVQNCISCHGAAQMAGQAVKLAGSDKKIPPLDLIYDPARMDRLVKQGHPAAPGVVTLKEKESKALVSYMDAHRTGGLAPGVPQ